MDNRSLEHITVKLRLEIKIYLKEEKCVLDTDSARKAWFVTSALACRRDDFFIPENEQHACFAGFQSTSAQYKSFLSTGKGKRKNEHKRKKIKSQTFSDE